jgi:hypothetical protein
MAKSYLFAEGLMRCSSRRTSSCRPLDPGLEVLHLDPERVLLLHRDQLLEPLLDAAESRTQLHDHSLEVVEPPLESFHSFLHSLEAHLDHLVFDLEPIETFQDDIMERLHFIA